MSGIINVEKTGKLKRRECELHACLRYVLRMCRWFGYFPVEASHNPRAMKFNLKSVYRAYFVYSCIILTYSTSSSVYRYLFWGKNFSYDLSNVMVSLSAMVVTVLMYRLAQHWPDLVQDAADAEQSIANTVRISKKTHLKCAILSYVVIGLGFVEHFLETNLKLQVEIYCSQDNELSLEVIEKFLRNHYGSIFYNIPFYWWMSIFAAFMKLQLSFLWNLTDVLGMCFSIYLTAYFGKLGKIINSDKPKDWSKIRACYSRLAILLNLINKQLSPFILLTSFCNLLFICKQLFFSLHKDIFDHKIPSCDNDFDGPNLDMSYLLYYVYSFVFLIIRSMGFVYMATNVHTSANNAVLPLYEVPSTDYDEEVKCFQMQLRYTTVGLYGVFFYVERQTVLRVIATIVTYELVLLQFSMPKKSFHHNYSTNFTNYLNRAIF